MKNLGRYEIVEELGRGATGVVYRASDPTLSRSVAIKVLTLGASDKDSTLGERDLFMREARAAGRLSHPGIVTIHDAVEDAENKLSYIVMEFINGQTLESLMVSETAGPPGTPLTPLPSERALGLAAQIGEALDYAHRHNIIHRDLKPANILVTHDGRSKIADFGIAKIVARDSTMRTAVMMGTPSFMSPEQVTGAEVDARSDLFSLGIILFVMLTGQRPFSGEPTAVMFKIAYQDPATPSQINPSLGADHDYIVLRCLTKDRAQRYSSAREFLEDLDDVRHGRPPRSAAGIPLSALRTADRTATASLRPVAPALDGGAESSVPPASTPPPASDRARASVPTEAQAASALSAANRERGRPNSKPFLLLVGGVLVAALVLGAAWIWRGRASNVRTAQATAAGTVNGTTPASATPAPSSEAAMQSQPAPTAGQRTGSPSTIRDSSPVGKVSPESRIAPASTEESGDAEAKSEGSAGLAPGMPAAGTRDYQLICKHNLDQGTLTISSEGHVLLAQDLKGKKKGVLGRRSGEIVTPIEIPTTAKSLSVTVTLGDGTVQVTRKVPATPPAANLTVLAIDVRGNNIKAHWQPPTPAQ